jgi:antirestriction protein ArdC
MDVYELITEKVVSKLEAGTVPWHKPWNVETGMPKNLVTKKEYRGINVFLLACQGYASPYWLTFNETKALGGSVKKGEKASYIVFWKWLERTDDAGKTEKYPMLRYYTVFNLEQTENVNPKKIPEVLDYHNKINPIDACDAIVGNMPNAPTVNHMGAKACYAPMSDTVTMPRKDSFDNAEEYYSTLFHELTHSTGHESRVNRDWTKHPVNFGSSGYSKEELVAEMGACFLCGVSGIDNKTIDNSAAYIKGWLGILKGNKNLVVTAAAQAQRAADYILGKKPTYGDQS